MFDAGSPNPCFAAARRAAVFDRRRDRGSASRRETKIPFTRPLMHKTLTLLLTAILASRLVAQTTQPVRTVDAWRSKDPSQPRPTRLLEDLTDFRPAPVRLDRFGGWEDGPAFAAGKFFRVEKSGDRTWLVTPGGRAFLHIAINAVSTANRRPGPGSAFPTETAWRDETLRRLRDWGFNGSGAWSRDAALRTASDNRVAYTPVWNFMQSYGKIRGGMKQGVGHMDYPENCTFVFDRAFADFCDRHAAANLAPLKDDPYLLGHFTDNELPWPTDALDRFMRLPALDEGRLAASRWVAERRARTPATQPMKYSAAERAAFREHLADTYFRTVTAAIRRHDPNHLILGSRFHGGELSSQGVLRAAGKYCDVISVNYYNAWTPRVEQLKNWATWSGRPLLITEWYARGNDVGFANTTGAGFIVPTQADRGRFYQNFTLALLESKDVVGWHWFKYVDNDPKDPSAEPSNRDSNKGVVTLDQKPYDDLVRYMKELNHVAYPLTAYFDRR
jgi:hypothetical protein